MKVEGLFTKKGIIMRSNKIRYITICVGLLGITFTKTNSLTLSFDSLFPLTWYQKGLESSLHIWQTLATMVENNDDKQMISYDILGRLTFIYFCVNRMQQENRSYIADDIMYLLAVLEKIQQLLKLMIPTSLTHDFLACADEIIVSMCEKLKGYC